MNNHMQSTVNSLLIKRQQFHTNIRRQQLDQYRQRKRQQIFGFGQQGRYNPNQTSNGKGKSQNSKLNILNNKLNMSMQNTGLSEQIKLSPYAFSQHLQDFLVRQSELKLSKENYSVQSIRQVLNLLTRTDLRQLANSQIHPHELLNRVLKILLKSMKNVFQIPPNSIIRKNNTSQIQQIQKMIFHSFKFVLIGICIQQRHQMFQSNKRKTQLNYYNQILKNKNNPIGQNSITFNKLSQLQKQKQSQQINRQVHPLESCNDQILQLLNIFYQLFREQKLKLQKQNMMQEPQSQNLLKQMDFYMKLWYLLSFLQHENFTPQFLQVYLKQIMNLNEIKQQMVDIFLQTLSNFVENQTPLNKQFNYRQSQLFPQIRYSPQSIKQIIQFYSSCLGSYNVADSSLMALVKSVKKLLLSYKKQLVPLLIQTNTIHFLIQQIKSQKKNVELLVKQAQKGQIGLDIFHQKYNEVKIGFQVKRAIFEMIGTVWSMVDDCNVIKQLFIHLNSLAQIIIYQFRKLTTQQSRFLISHVQQISQIQSTTQTIIFLLLNMLSCSVTIIDYLIQWNFLKQILDLWNYFHNLNQTINKPNSALYNEKKYVQINKIKQMIIWSIYNIVFTLIKGESFQASQSMDIFVQYKSCGFIKLIVDFLKSIAYDLDISFIQKDTVRYALRSLNKLLQHVLYSGMEDYFMKSFQTSHQFTLGRVKSVLNTIMISENKFQQKITNQALGCLQLFDRIIDKNGGYLNQQIRDQQYSQTQQNNFYQQSGQRNDYINQKDQTQYQI